MTKCNPVRRSFDYIDSSHAYEKNGERNETKRRAMYREKKGEGGEEGRKQVKHFELNLKKKKKKKKKTQGVET